MCTPGVHGLTVCVVCDSACAHPGTVPGGRGAPPAARDVRSLADRAPVTAVCAEARRLALVCQWDDCPTSDRCSQRVLHDTRSTARPDRTRAPRRRALWHTTRDTYRARARRAPTPSSPARCSPPHPCAAAARAAARAATARAVAPGRLLMARRADGATARWAPPPDEGRTATCVAAGLGAGVTSFRPLGQVSDSA